MKKILSFLILTAVVLSACRSTATPTAVPTEAPSLTPSPAPTATPAPTETPSPTPTPLYPTEGYGPSNFPADVNPLTGLRVSDPALLGRRPLAVKITNLPRDVRPQWGLTLADIVFEYYTELGSTRFIALFYGNDASQAGPIRSARLFDGHVVRMYKAVLAFGSGDERVRNRLFATEYASRLVSEFPAGCPPMCRYEPNTFNYLITDTSALSKYATASGISNERQNLDGMFFQLQPPDGGEAANRVFVRYSGAIYNRWDYDAASGRYLRFSESQDDLTGNEVYAQLTDRLTGQPVAADNVVVVFVNHEYYSVTPEIVDTVFNSSGTAYVFREGKGYKVKWQRPAADSIIYLTYEDGTPFPLKPGTTWFEMMGAFSRQEKNDQGWRFTFTIP